MVKRYLRRSQRVVFIDYNSCHVYSSFTVPKNRIAGGNYLYKVIKIVKRIDVEKFKKLLDTSLPLIDVTYNRSRNHLLQVRK